MTIDPALLIIVCMIGLTPYWIIGYIGKMIRLGYEHPWMRSMAFDIAAGGLAIVGWFASIVGGIVNGIWGSDNLWIACIVFVILSLIAMEIGNRVANSDAKRYSY